MTSATSNSPAMATPASQAIPLQQSAQQNPLAEMRDLHLPQSIDSWPWAPGWYLLIAVTLIAVSLGIYFWIKHKRENLYKRQALQELETIKTDYQYNLNSQQCAQAISALLKKIALVHFPREKISLLSGENWLQFLDKLSNSKHFTEGAGSLLGDRLFQNHNTLTGHQSEQKTAQETQQLITHCESLIKQLNKKRLKGIRL